MCCAFWTRIEGPKEASFLNNNPVVPSPYQASPESFEEDPLSQRFDREVQLMH